MIVQCSFSPDPIWVRGLDNGMCHVTLRRNIIKQANTLFDGKQETVYQFEETDIFIPDRVNLIDFINSNFEQLFMSNLSNYKKSKIELINTLCNTEICSGFKATNGHTYKFDLNYQANFTGGATMFNGDPTMTQMPFNTQDAGMIMHTKEDFLQTCKDAMNFKQEKLTKYFDLQGKVVAARDYLSVDAINW